MKTQRLRAKSGRVTPPLIATLTGKTERRKGCSKLQPIEPTKRGGLGPSRCRRWFCAWDDVDDDAGLKITSPQVHLRAGVRHSLTGRRPRFYEWLKPFPLDDALKRSQCAHKKCALCKQEINNNGIIFSELWVDIIGASTWAVDHS